MIGLFLGEKDLPNEIIKGVDFEPVELKGNDDILFMKEVINVT